MPDLTRPLAKNNTFDSKYTFGDHVWVRQFGAIHKATSGRITAVKFTSEKIFYSVRLDSDTNEPPEDVYDVDSALVETCDSELFGSTKVAVLSTNALTNNYGR
jgi:hypothetical protein